jgi:hypothetical protein
MPPESRPIPRFVAEPPQEPLPYGRWADALAAHLLAAAARIDADDDIGDAGEISWFPERTWSGRTYVPATAPTSNGFELFGYVSFARASGSDEPRDFLAVADYTDETAAANPDWELDLSDQEIAAWRGPEGRSGDMTLVWGVALRQNGAIVTAELGPTTTDQCELAENRFTLVSLDNYTGDYIEVKLWGRGGGELASESLYEEEDED